MCHCSHEESGFFAKRIYIYCFPFSSEPVQWTTIPVLVKIYKLLINELSNQIETNMCKAGKEEDEEEEEDWEDEDVDGEKTSS